VIEVIVSDGIIIVHKGDIKVYVKKVGNYNSMLLMELEYAS
jgi:hypothetical protein